MSRVVVLHLAFCSHCFLHAQARRQIEFGALCESFRPLRLVFSGSLFPWPVKRVNGDDNAENAGGGGCGRLGALVEIPSINKSAAKFLFTRVAIDNVSSGSLGQYASPLVSPSFPGLPAGTPIAPTNHTNCWRNGGWEKAETNAKRRRQNQIKLLNWIKIGSWKTEKYLRI